MSILINAFTSNANEKLPDGRFIYYSCRTQLDLVGVKAGTWCPVIIMDPSIDEMKLTLMDVEGNKKVFYFTVQFRPESTDESQPEIKV